MGGTSARVQKAVWRAGRYLVVAAAVLALLPVLGRAEEGRKFFFFAPKEKLIEKMDDPARDGWQKPEQVTDHLLIRPGETVADIGAGSGYFSFEFSRRVGEKGKVLAVDIDRQMLDHIAGRAKKAGSANIVTLLAKSDDPLLARDSVDLVFICNTYWYLPDRARYLRHLRAAIRPGGRLAIISYRAEETPVGPPLGKRVSRETVLDEVRRAGFREEAEYFFLPYQYFLVFSRN